jgi:proteic killer suppression protein
VIESFKDKATENIWEEIYSKKFPKEMQKIALRKLILLHRAKDLNDLRIPPGNRLEQLSGNRKGQYSIRINNQWRICFHWNNGAASEVEITDYH